MSPDPTPLRSRSRARGALSLLLAFGLLLAPAALAQGPFTRELFAGLEGRLGKGPPRIDAADLDGDGDLDVVAGWQASSGLDFLARRDGFEVIQFLDPFHVLYRNPLAVVDVRAADPKLADLDGDGDLDAIVGGLDGRLEYYENSGTPEDPVFSGAAGSSNPFAGVEVGGRSSPELVDLDNDGDLDAVVGNWQGTLQYFENSGAPHSPSFAPATGGASPFSGIDVGWDSSPDLVDLDGDGDFDAVVGGRPSLSSEAGALRYFENAGTPESPRFVERTGAASPLQGIAAMLNVLYRGAFGGIRSPEVTDLEGDGDLDVFVGGSRIEVFRRACPGELCLGDDRFSVDATWRDAHGRTGRARAAPFDDGDSAALWFFSPANWELAVKVIDGCAYNDHFWVFVSGLTDLEVEVRVEDTLTGRVRVYENQLGQPFKAVQDTRAFATCPPR